MNRITIGLLFGHEAVLLSGMADLAFGWSDGNILKVLNNPLDSLGRPG